MAFGHDPSDFAHEKFSAFVIKVIEGDYTVADNVDRLYDWTAIFDRRVHLTFGVFVDESGEADFFALLHDQIITRLSKKCSENLICGACFYLEGTSAKRQESPTMRRSKRERSSAPMSALAPDVPETATVVCIGMPPMVNRIL